MTDVRDLPMFTEDDIPDFSKLGAGNFLPAVEKAVTRIEVLRPLRLRPCWTMETTPRCRNSVA